MDEVAEQNERAGLEGHGIGTHGGDPSNGPGARDDGRQVSVRPGAVVCELLVGDDCRSFDAENSGPGNWLRSRDVFYDEGLAVVALDEGAVCCGEGLLCRHGYEGVELWSVRVEYSGESEGVRKGAKAVVSCVYGSHVQGCAYLGFLRENKGFERAEISGRGGLRS